MNVSAMNTTAYAVPQNAAKQPQTAERVQGAQAVDAAKAPAAKEAGAAFDVKISDAAREKAAEKVAADQDAPAKNGKTKGLTADEVKALQDDIDNSYNILIKTMTEQNAKLQAWQADGTGFLNFDGRKVLTAQFALPDVATTPEDAKKAIADGGDWSVNAVADRIMKTKLYFDDTSSTTVLDIRTRARRLKAEHGLDLIAIDYLQLIQAPGRAENRTLAVAEMTRSLKVLARELNVPIIVLSQLSRATEGRSDKRPMLSDLRESGSIEQDADVIFFIHRDDRYDPDAETKGMAEIIIGKQRNGPIGSVTLAFQGQYTKFENFAAG